jgi:hypothetical protein
MFYALEFSMGHKTAYYFEAMHMHLDSTKKKNKTLIYNRVIVKYYGNVPIKS